MADCDNSVTYFKAAEYLYKLQPTYTAACGLAAQAFNKKDINGAISYLNQAANYTKSSADKSNIMLKISSIYNKRGKTGRTREYARKALTYNSSNGYAYLMIAQLYANSARSISSNALVQQTAFWAAADKAERAKQVDHVVQDRLTNCSASTNVTSLQRRRCSCSVKMRTSCYPGCCLYSARLDWRVYNCKIQ